MFSHKPLVLLLQILLLTGLQGCGGSGPKAVKVKGKITLDGQPLPEATVTLHPIDKSARQAIGQTKSDGTFAMSTFSTGDGALPGDYTVTVVWKEAIDYSKVATPDQDKSMTIEKMMIAYDKMRKEIDKKKKPKYVIPAKYSDMGKTVLKWRVPSDSDMELDLESK